MSQDEKNWFIRTVEQEILGPVSFLKIQALIEKNVLKDEDEICKKNSYWVFVREKELIKKMSIDCSENEFHPISQSVSDLNKKNIPQSFSNTSQKIDEIIDLVDSSSFNDDKVDSTRITDVDIDKNRESTLKKVIKKNDIN